MRIVSRLMYIIYAIHFVMGRIVLVDSASEIFYLSIHHFSHHYTYDSVSGCVWPVASSFSAPLPAILLALPPHMSTIRFEKTCCSKGRCIKWTKCRQRLSKLNIACYW